MTKLIVIVGITGVQGGSVARTFLKDPSFKIRGITRDPSKPESQALIAQGIEVVKGDVDDVSTLKSAFAGADIIFGNTAFSSAFSNPTPDVLAQLKPGQTVREWCYDTEVQQGKNLVDAVATVIDGLEMFIWSTLSPSAKWSKEKYKGIYHFDSKGAVVDYIHEKYPQVAKKMNMLQMGLFITNWKWGQASVPWEKRPDGSMLLKIPGSGDVPIPLVVPSDAGIYTKALTQTSPGKNLLAYSSLIPWAEYVKLWSSITGVPAAFEHSTVAAMDKLAPGGFGEEMGEMYAYGQDFGYWGGDPDIIHPKDLGIEEEVTSLKDYIKNEDWSELLSRPVPA